MKAIYRRAGQFSSEVELRAGDGENATVLQPLAQAVVQLETNRKNFNLRLAIAERAIMTAMTFHGQCGSFTLMVTGVIIDMSSGRETNIVFDAKGDVRISLTFSDQIKVAWLASAPSPEQVD